ncbi:MAG TPA: hypothetical protein VGJ80_10025 [Gemmatimonadales bacterium]
MVSRNTSALAVAFAITMLAAACGGGDGGTGPGQLADPAATAAKIAALDDAFETPSFASFAFAATYVPAASVSLNALHAALAAAAVPTPDHRPAFETLRPSLPARSASGSSAIFPPEVLGKTLEWSSTSGIYEATARAGAPANGVRFILYSLGTNGQPVTPLQEIGYVDFKDESAAGTDRLHITVVVGTTTFVDYTIAFSFGSSTSFNYGLAGFVTDGTRRLDLSIAFDGNDTNSSVDIRFDLNAENAHIRLTETVVTLSDSSFRLTMDTRVQLGSEVIATAGSATVTVSGTSFTVTGTYTVTVNGRDYATITQSGDGTVVAYRYAGGRDLTSDEIAALNAVFSAVSDLLIRMFDLLLPVY